MLDQITFDRSEEIADALHEQAGLARALEAYLSDRLSPEDANIFNALMISQEHCRNRAMGLSGDIARSGGPSG